LPVLHCVISSPSIRLPAGLDSDGWNGPVLPASFHALRYGHLHNFGWRVHPLLLGQAGANETWLHIDDLTSPNKAAYSIRFRGNHCLAESLAEPGVNIVRPSRSFIGVILNVLKEELLEERQSRFAPFALGAALYALA
jgi:hypothetical protein